MAEAAVQTRRIAPATIALVAAGLIAVAAILYSVLRGDGGTPSSAAGNVAAPTATPAQSIERMQEALRSDPDNHRGWFLLGLALKGEGRFAEAQTAFRRAMQLQPREADYLASLAEMLLVNGGGNADREAEGLLRQARELRPDHPAPRYYLAVLRDQKGEHREAIDDLLTLLREAPAGAPWEGQVREAAERIAAANNIDIAGRLPAPRPSSAATAAIPGPTQEQMDAARGLPPSQQDEMVKGMVDRLAARLRENPRNEQGWMMLMRSRVVQGERDGAGEALRSGLAAFADDAAAQQRLRAAAAELGVPQG